MPKPLTVQVGGDIHGRVRAKLGLGLIRCGCWLCRAYRIDVTVNGVKTRTLRSSAKLTVTMTGNTPSQS